MSNLILPGQQQPTELQIGINDQGPVSTLVVAGNFAIQFPPMPLEGIEGIANTILSLVKQTREKRALIASQVNGPILQVV